MKKKTKYFPFLNIQKQRFALHFINQSTAIDLPHEKQFYQWIWYALKDFYRRADISLVLMDEDEARAYNRDFRDKDYATNVLSFAHREGEYSFVEQVDVLQGDLILCPAVIAREAAQQNKTLTAHYAHLAIHGTLHLMGFDHMNEAEAAEMEGLEIRLLSQLGIANPYECFRLPEDGK